ncbi:MAG TPA: hypothetical protein VGL99_01125 [Chloroflexota bacterium]
MFVVVASSRDRIAARLVARWGADRARLLTCRDLSRAGWRYRPGAADRGVAVIGGQRVPAAEVDGVLVRLPCVSVAELAHIAPVDRPYVAREMTAFLTAWLTDLPCPVVNRPSAACLAGPGWGAQQWRQVTRRLGLAIVGRGRRSSSVTVVGERSLGAASGSASAHRLAEAAAMTLLDVHFDPQQRVVAIDPWPDVSRPAVADALLEYLQRS